MKKRFRLVVLTVIVFLIIFVLPAISASQESGKEGSNIFNIDYDKPEKYLKLGKMTKIEISYLDAIRQEISVTGKTIDDLRVIFLWKQLKFRKAYAAGKFVGKSTVNSLYEQGVLTGHHDDGIVLVSILREFGFPAVMVDAAGIQWSHDYTAGKTTEFLGHVYVEVFVEGKWILMDTTSGRYIENYNPLDPVIPLPIRLEPKGFYVMFKGIDTADYGVKSYKSLKKKMKAHAKIISGLKITPPKYIIKKF